MFDILNNKYNIHQRKTYDENFEIPEGSIPENLMRHFVRGYFDGDGHKGDSYIEFVVNSEFFMNQLINFFDNHSYRYNLINGKTCNYYKLYITGGNKRLSEIKKLFYDNSNYFLQRKYILFNTEVNSEITKGSESP